MKIFMTGTRISTRSTSSSCGLSGALRHRPGVPRAGWRVVRVCVIVGGLCMAASAWAVWPGYYLVSVYENEGLATVDFKYWGVKKPNSAPVHWPEVGFGYGVTKRWYTELYASYVGSAGVPYALSDINWQNDYLLTQGQYPFDLALHTNLKWFNNPADGHFLEWGPALQTELGARTQLNANVFFERTFNAQVNPSASNATQLKYQWQVKHRWLREF